MAHYSSFTFPSHSHAFPFLTIPSHINLLSLSTRPHLFQKGHRFMLVNCKSTFQSESETTPPVPLESSPSPSPYSSVSSVIEEDNKSILAYKWCATLGGIGFLETSYMTYLKLTMGGGSCNATELSSPVGVPLSLFGMLAYGFVSILGLQLQLGPKKRAFDFEKTHSEMILIGATTSMAVASAYLLYILSTEFDGESCIYCLASATLSFSLFFITLKNFGLDKIKKMLGSQLCIASLVVITLAGSYNVMQPVPSSLAATVMPHIEANITKESSPLALSLARHLHSIGAKLYGAFWCSHCVGQRQMFGREAAELLDYVECFPDGVREGAKMDKACYDIDLKGFPTWEINGQVLTGEKQFSELARLSGIKLEDLSQ